MKDVSVQVSLTLIISRDLIRDICQRMGDYVPDTGPTTFTFAFTG